MTLTNAAYARVRCYGSPIVHYARRTSADMDEDDGGRTCCNISYYVGAGPRPHPTTHFAVVVPDAVTCVACLAWPWVWA